MKSKNMVLLALAVGCGLVAAFLTAKLGAGSKQEMIPVLVAAKNLDQGTKLDKIEEQFVRKPFPKESVPPEFIDDPAQFKGKSLQRSVRAGDAQVALTPLEFRLLAAFVRHPNQVLSQDQLIELAWGNAGAAERDQVKLYVGYLRRKLGTPPGAESPIETMRGFGYRYRPPAAG